MTSPLTGRIFISYRRADSAGYAGRLYDRLAAHFGKESIFMDVDTIQAGLDFVEVLKNAVQSCDVLVSLMGRQWLNIRDEEGKRRLDNHQDFVRIEVATALSRGIRVIPVLVDGTSMPNSDQLPDNLKPLVRRNAVLVNHHSFHADADRLIEHLELALKAAEDSKILIAKKLKEEEVQKKRQAEIENLLSQTDIALDLQDWELAKEKIEAVLTLKPDHIQAQVKLAIVERKRLEIKEKAEQQAKEKADRLAKQKAEKEMIAKAKLEEEQLAKVKKNAEQKNRIGPKRPIKDAVTTQGQTGLIKWGIIGIIGLCIIGTGAWGVSYLAGINPSITETATSTIEEPAMTEASPIEFEGKSLVASNCDNFVTIKSIEATDKYTVNFNLCEPDPAFLPKLALGSFAIYPEEWIESTAGNDTRNSDGLERPIGTGPYMVIQWNRGESIAFTAFPNYWGKPAIAQNLIFRWESDSSKRLQDLQNGTVDGIDLVALGNIEEINNDPRLSIRNRSALNIFYMGINNTSSPFDNKLVRQAIATGIDRNQIVDNYFPPGSKIATHFTPCEIPNGCVGIDWYDFDPEYAKELLAEAGYPNGFSTELYYRDVVRSYLPDAKAIALELQMQLRNNLNIEAELVVLESSEFFQELLNGELENLYLMGWTADYSHITAFLNVHFEEINPQFGKQSPTYYDLFGQANRLTNVRDSAPIYADINDAIREYVPMIPLTQSASSTAYSSDVTGQQASPYYNERFASMNPGDRNTFIWEQIAEPISLFCADESNGESLRACAQIMDTLYSYESNGVDVEPALAKKCEPNEDLTIWVCSLRQGVVFHDGTTFDANDVVATFTMGLDASSPLHVGNLNSWDYYAYIWGLINQPQ